jgi:8-oxo-dGTP pyrophosphatase MutT (NUDIX family)
MTNLKDLHILLRSWDLNTLPSTKAHQKMLPPKRKIHPQNRLISPLKSAVLILIYKRNNEILIPFIIRKSFPVNVHSGQIAFPGGKKEEKDKDMQATALREAEEEIGIKTNTVNIICKISDLYIPPSNFLVSPFIGITYDIPNFIAQKSEVDDIIEIPLHFFLQENIIQYRNIGDNKNIPCFIYQQHIIWGATAMMMNEFIYLLKEILEESSPTI